jgi:hypothetical protein
MTAKSVLTFAFCEVISARSFCALCSWERRATAAAASGSGGTKLRKLVGLTYNPKIDGQDQEKEIFRCEQPKQKSLTIP